MISSNPSLLLFESLSNRNSFPGKTTDRCDNSSSLEAMFVVFFSFVFLLLVIQLKFKRIPSKKEKEMSDGENCLVGFSFFVTETNFVGTRCAVWVERLFLGDSYLLMRLTSPF